jgi:hypothetical protein
LPQIKNTTTSTITITAFINGFAFVNFGIPPETTSAFIQPQVFILEDVLVPPNKIIPISLEGCDSVQIVFDSQKTLTHHTSDTTTENNIINNKNFVKTGTAHTRYYFKKNTQTYLTYTITDADYQRAR